MKACGKCGNEISTKDGDNNCGKCRNKKKAAESRKMRDQAMRDLGLTKVRGAMGGTYWE